MKQLIDQYFTYRQTPVDYDGVARPSIKGNTLCWNQLVDSGTTSVTLTSGHVYITKVGTTWSRVSGTGQSITVTGGSDCVFDLTKMYKSGNEPTLDEFRSLFPLNYYAYGQYLLNFNGTGIKTTGFNQWDEEWEVGAWNASTGQAETANDRIRSKNFIPVLPDTTYYYGRSLRVVMYDGDKNYISYKNYGEPFTITTPNNCHYIKFNANAVYGVVYNNDICINISSDRNGEYEPYTSSTTSLPISTYFPTGMKSAGAGTSKVYDELNDKATTRVGNVDLGTLDYTYNSTYTRFAATMPSDYKKPTSASDRHTFTCAKYEANDEPLSDQSTKNGISGYQGASTIYIRDTAYTDATTFKNAMSGVYLNYELATYTEQDVDPIYYDFYGNGTEQLLPVNTDTPSTSPLLADIIYYNLTDSEVPYRVFWAINSKGERWDFTEREFKSFMNNPQGLGFSKTISVNRYGNVQNLTDITDNFPQPNGEILFYDSHNSTRYDKYNQFVKFLSYEPITLYYKIPVSFYSRIPNTYSLECVVGTLTKTESKTDNMMNCSITYNALSFYKGEEVEISGTGLTYTINNDGDFPVGFEIEINATYNYYMQNPYIQLSQDGSLYGEAKFIDATRFNKVYINSKDGEQNVILQQSGSVLPNPMSYQDLSISNGSIYVTFVKLARGETTLTIGADSQNITDVTIRYTPIYRSV